MKKSEIIIMMGGWYRKCTILLRDKIDKFFKFHIFDGMIDVKDFSFFS